MFEVAAPPPVGCIISTNMSASLNRWVSSSISCTSTAWPDHRYLDAHCAESVRGNVIVLSPSIDPLGGTTSVVIVGQASAIIPDALLVGATWRHAYTVKMAIESQVDAPLITILVRDGRHKPSLS